MPRLGTTDAILSPERVTPVSVERPPGSPRDKSCASENYARMAFANLAVELAEDKAAAVVAAWRKSVAERRQFLVQVRIQKLDAKLALGSCAAVGGAVWAGCCTHCHGGLARRSLGL